MKIEKTYVTFEQEIVGHRLKPFIDRIMVDGILKNAMPIWNDEDKSVYFIRGHVGGSLVAKMKELKVLDLWFTPIYESEEVKSDWIKEHHIDYYKKEGMMADKPKQETLVEKMIPLQLKYNLDNMKQKAIEEAVERMYPINSTGGVMEMLNKHQLNNSYKQEGFIAGVKLQAERMYSEEEVLRIITSCKEYLSFGDEFNEKQWFSQFKKQGNGDN